METLVSNLAGKTRRETFDGRQFLVAPVTLIVPGVLNGSCGPLLYSSDEIAKNVDAWNGIPLVVDHPVDDSGQFVSARSPSILDAQGVGHLFQANANGKLTAEGWFDVEKTSQVDDRIMQSLEAGKPIELSTGLIATSEPVDKGAAFNGTPYSFIARNYRPDHLAILLDQVGACSLEDGCGVLANSINASAIGKINQLLGITDNELSHDDLRTSLSVKLKERFGSGSTDVEDPWVVDTFQNKVIYAFNGKHFRLGFSRAKDKVSLSDLLPVEVTRITQWKVTTNTGGQKMSLSDNQKKKIVDDLIANTCCWEEEDREMLSALSDNKLTAMKEHGEKEVAEKKRHEVLTNAMKKGVTDPGGNNHVWSEEKNDWVMKPKEKEKEPVANQNAPPTEAEWLATAPESVREDLEFARAEKSKQKSALVKQLVANVKDEQHQARLSDRFLKKSLGDLQDMVAILPEDKQVPVANWSGSPAPGSSSSNAEENFAPFGLPNDYIKDESDKN
ncbi:hypothetical protein LCGC14_0429150 [marine sediment metagenome]|uniref:DUF2213 domain-containing protein n=1 Tax=marine sediment metagenome TaxID=412755 RepID=A0A0F9T6S0_9ZZZZ